jgi:hypothetical protein
MILWYNLSTEMIHEITYLACYEPVQGRELARYKLDLVGLQRLGGRAGIGIFF